ncbi:MAG: hypothetical protein ACR2MA_01915 [Egibacteraceae bacterium]
MSSSEWDTTEEQPFYKKPVVLAPVGLWLLSKFVGKGVSALRTRRRRKAIKELRQRQRARDRARRQRAAAKRKVKRSLSRS